MEEDEELEKLRELVSAYKAMDEQINDTIDLMIKGLSKDQLKELFRQVNRDYLKMILEEIALVKENYEACQAIKEVMEEK